MEKNNLEKHNSFSKNEEITITPTTTPHSVSISEHTFDHQPTKNGTQENDLIQEFDMSYRDQVSEEIDQFAEVLLALNDKSIDHVPEFVETFAKIVESKIDKYNSGEIDLKLGEMAKEGTFFFEDIKRVSKLVKALNEFPSNATTDPPLNRTSGLLQRAMAFLEEEFRAILEESRDFPEHENLRLGKFSSFNSKITQDPHSDRCTIRREAAAAAAEGDDYPGYSPEIVTKMQGIASAMISSGYETECCQVYSISRRNSIGDHMRRQEFEKINMDDVSRMAWESLEVEIWRWIKVVKNCSEIVFPGEMKLGESVFSDYPLISRSLFSNLARSVVIQLLDFAEATTMVKRSPEKVFKFLDMYEALQNLIQSVARCEELATEISATVNRIGEAAASNFCDLENSIQNDGVRTAVPGGAVHPLTRYVMNYLKYASEYKDALEKIFEKNSKLFESNNTEKDSESPRTTPFSAQVVTVMDLLDENLEKKSWNYRDPSLRYIFLMNNGRYILQKVKGSPEIQQVMGDTWCRRKSTVLRQYHKNYQRETWHKVLNCLVHDGLQVNGKVNKPMLKERFKIFTATFDEIHRTQSMWVVSDMQLRSELQVSVSALVIPAYRSFVGRFGQHLDPGKQAEKYIKYQPDDIENLIEGLFEGNAASMNRKKT